MNAAILESETKPYITPSKPEQKPEAWWKLHGTGFNVEKETDCLLRIYSEQTRSGISSQNALAKAIAEVRGNIIGYKFEYIMQRSLLPNPVTLHQVNGRLRLVNSLSLQPLDDATTEQERFGSVKRAIQKVEAHLIDPNSTGQELMAVIESPDKWSGIKTSEGKEIDYTSSQTYAFRKRSDGVVEAFTIVTDKGFNESRHFLAKLGKDINKVGIGPDQKHRIANIVDEVVLLSGEDAKQGFAGIVDKIRQTRREVAGVDIARTIKTTDGSQINIGFEEIMADLKKERLLESDKHCELSILKLEAYIQKLFLSKDEVNRDDIEKMIALTVVNISRAIKGDNALNYNEVYAPQEGNVTRFQQRVFLKEFAHMKQLAGCNGGGLNTSATGIAVTNGLGTRMGIAASRSESGGSNEVYCSTCKADKKAGSCGFCSDCYPE